MCCWDPIEFPQVALGLVPEILDTIDVVVTVGEELGMVDPEVVEVRHVQLVVALPAVGVDDRIGDLLALDDWHQCGPGCVWDNLGINLSTPV